MVYTRIAVKNVADEFGFKATMCPKPLGPNEIGNGGHVVGIWTGGIDGLRIWLV